MGSWRSPPAAKYKSDMLARIEVVEQLPLGHAVFEASMESTLKRYAIREFHRVQVKVKEGVSEFPPMFLDTFSRRDSWVGSDAREGGDAHKTGSGPRCLRRGNAARDAGGCAADLERQVSARAAAMEGAQARRNPARGGSGSGKTAAVSALCHRLSKDVDVLAATKFIDCKTVASAKAFQQMLHFAFTWAKSTAPAVIVLDNLDVALTEASQDEAGHDLPRDPGCRAAGEAPGRRHGLGHARERRLDGVAPHRVCGHVPRRVQAAKVHSGHRQV